MLTTPVIRCLKKQKEQAEVHFLTKTAYKTVLSNNPYLDKLWLYEKELDPLIKQLKEEKFDAIIDLHHNLRSAIVKRRLRVPSFSFRKLNFKKWLMVNFKINHLPEKHIVDRYLETVKSLGVSNDNKGLDYFLNEKDKYLPAETESLLQERYISVVIGAQHSTKKAPPEVLAEILNKTNIPAVLLGGPEDKDEGDRVLSHSRSGTILNLCGKLSLNQSVSVLKRSELVVSHDTGLMHIAAAYKKRIISLWGNTIPEFGMYPYLAHEDSKIFEVKDLSCRPCSKIGFQKCPKKHFHCMMHQNTEAIAHTINFLTKGDSKYSEIKQ